MSEELNKSNTEGVIDGTGESKSDFLERKKNELVKTASAYVQQRPYASPFLSLSDMHIPERTVELFKWCKYFYTFDPVIHGAINALSTFPVTQIMLDEPDSYAQKQTDEAEKFEESPQMASVKYMLFDRVKIYKLLIEIGIDYFLYGNCFIYGDIEKNETTEEFEWANVRRFSPDRIYIDVTYTGKAIYKWNPPQRIVQIVKKKAPKDIYKTIPKIVIDAIEKNKSIVINKDRIFHFKKPSDSLIDSAWGMPGIANVLKLLMYRNILRQAQEAIAKEHIVPLRIFFLNPTDGTSVGAVSGGFKVGGMQIPSPVNGLAAEIEKFSADPNYKIISSVPVGMVTAGGHGRSLLLTPEIDQVQSEILAGMNVPREFIFGGVSFSGSSISLKILENHFITYRLLLEDFINSFLIKGLAKERGEWKTEADNKNLVKARFADLKMQDDVQQKQMMLNLNAAGKISDAYLLKIFGVDPDRMLNSIKRETKLKANIKKDVMLSEIDSNLEMQKATLVAQTKFKLFQDKFNKWIAQHGIEPVDDDTITQIIEKIEKEIELSVQEQRDAIESQVMEQQMAQQGVAPEGQGAAPSQPVPNESIVGMAGDIVENLVRDPEYGSSLLDVMKGKISPSDFAQLLEASKQILTANYAGEKSFDEAFATLEEYAYMTASELTQQNGTQPQPAQQQIAAQTAPPTQPAQPGQMGMPEQQQNIDMREMPAQLPPRRDSLK